MDNEKSVRKTKIDPTKTDLLSFFNDSTVKWAAFICAGLFIISPFIVGILCLIYHRFDYTVYAYPKIINVIWILSALSGFFAIFVKLGKTGINKKKILNTIKGNPAFVFFAFLTVWMIISFIVNGCEVYALFGAGLRFESIFMQLGYSSVLFPAAALIKDENKKLKLARLHEVASLFLVPVAFILWKYQQTSPMFDWTPSFTAIYSNTNYYGYYLAVSVPLAAAMLVAEKKPVWKIVSAVTLAANAVALSYNDTMGAWVACGIAMIFIFITHIIVEKKFNVWVVIAAAIFAAGLFLPGIIRQNLAANTAQLGADITNIVTDPENAGTAGSGRWLIWKRNIELILQYPVFGIGFEGIDARELIDFTGNYRAHNEYLQYTVFYGIPAGIAYICGFFTVFLRALKRRAELSALTLVCLTATFGYLVSAFFGLTLFCTTPFLFIFLGMGYTCGKAKKAPPPGELAPQGD